MIDEARARLAGIAPPQPDNLVVHRVVSTYLKGDREWKLIVISPKLSRSDLTSLAKQLHGKYPETAFHIFDDGSQMRAYENWTRNYPNPQFLFPERWAKKHHLAMVNKMLESGGSRWQLLGADGHPTHPNATIAYLDEVP